MIAGSKASKNAACSPSKSEAIRAGNGTAEPAAIALPENVPCPSCGKGIPVSQLITAHLQRSLEEQHQTVLEAGIAEREASLNETRQALETERTQLRETLKKAEKAKADAIRVQQEIEDARARIQLEADDRVKKEAEQIRQREQARAERDADRRVKERETEIRVLETRLLQAEQAELKIREESTNLKAREDAVELEIARRLDKLREPLVQDLARKANETASIEVRRREEEISRLREKIATLSLPTGPTELVGETLEKVVKSAIIEACPLDQIADVPRGRSGADLIQTVLNAAGIHQGKILYEIKNTRSYDPKWLAKLKSAQQDADADVAILVSAVLPKDIHHLGLCDQTWVCSPSAVAGVALLVRHALLRISTARSLADKKESRLAALHTYLASTQFRLSCESMVSLVQELERQLETEQRAMTRAWHRRRQVTLEISQGIVGLLGSLEGALRCELVPSLDYKLDESKQSLAVGRSTAVAE